MAKVLELVVFLAISFSCTWSLDICEDQIDGAQILFPTDCSKYVVCKFGTTYAVEQCNGFSHFNRLTSQCDEPIEAACDAGVIKNLISKSGECDSCRTACGCLSESDCTTSGSTSQTPALSTPTFATPATPTPTSPTPASPNPASTNADTPTPASPATDTPTPASPTSTSPSPSSPEPASPTPTSATPASSIRDSPTSASPATDTSTPASPTSTSPSPSSPELASPTPTSPTLASTTNSPSCMNDLQICIGQPNYSSVYVNESCSQYAICILGCANVLSCPNNLLYDLASHSCTYPENVNCPYSHSAPTGPSAGPSGTTCEKHGKCENQPDGALFADDSSNGYIVCQCECEILRPCPATLIFNDSLKVCDFPQNEE